MSACQGRIRRNFGPEVGKSDDQCYQSAAFAVRNNDTDAILGACRHHLAQVIDEMEAESVLVVPVRKS